MSNTATNVDLTFATREVTYRAYDSLPRPLRNVLADAPHNYDPREAREFWLQQRSRGWTAEMAAAAYRKIIAQHVQSLMST